MFKKVYGLICKFSNWFFAFSVPVYNKGGAARPFVACEISLWTWGDVLLLAWVCQVHLLQKLWIPEADKGADRVYELTEGVMLVVVRGE